MRDESLAEYVVYDALIQDRNGSMFSVWYAVVRNRLWFVEYAVCGMPIKRVEFADPLQ